MISLEVSDYRNTDEKEEDNDFLVVYSSTIAVVLFEILMEEMELSVPRNSKFEYRTKSK